MPSGGVPLSKAKNFGNAKVTKKTSGTLTRFLSVCDKVKASLLFFIS